MVNIASELKHVMEFTKIRVLEASFALIRKGLSNVIEYNESHPDIPLEKSVLIKYMRKWALFSLIWGIAGSATLSERARYSKKIAPISPVEMPPLGAQDSLIDF